MACFYDLEIASFFFYCQGKGDWARQSVFGLAVWMPGNWLEPGIGLVLSCGGNWRGLISGLVIGLGWGMAFSFSFLWLGSGGGFRDR